MNASGSRVNTASRCLKKYDYRYNEKIQKIYQDSKPQLGVIGHQALEAYFKGQDWTAPVAAYEVKLRKLMDEEREQYAHIPADLYRMLRGYLNNWRKVDADIEVLAVELPFEVVTPAGNIYEGIIDLIYRDAEGVWVCDHKFVKAIPSEAVRYMDAQTNMYFYAAQQLGFNPIGVVFDYVRTKPPTQPKLLKNGTISKAECDTDAETYLAAVKSAGLEPSDYMDMLEKLRGNVFYKRTRVPRPEKLTQNILKDFDVTCNLLAGLGTLGILEVDLGEKIYPRSLSRDCAWDCEYSELCFAELTGVDSSFIRAANYKPVEKREKREIDYGSTEES